MKLAVAAPLVGMPGARRTMEDVDVPFEQLGFWSRTARECNTTMYRVCQIICNSPSRSRASLYLWFNGDDKRLGRVKRQQLAKAFGKSHRWLMTKRQEYLEAKR